MISKHGYLFRPQHRSYFLLEMMAPKTVVEKALLQVLALLAFCA